MDYKKKYNEAQKWIESIYSELSHEQQMEAEAFFPELKESEDERIRKLLVEAVTQVLQDQYCSNRGVSKEKVVAWLEKQGQTYTKKDVDDAYVEGIASAKNELKKQGKSELKDNKDEKIRKKIIETFKNLGDGKIPVDINYADIFTWLENQGEQKPVMNVPPREVILAIWELGNEWKELTTGSILEHGTQLDYIQKHWQESTYYLTVKQGEQKPTDKVEPKFHEGEWITIKE